ncbi:cytochrome c oxidase subunit 2 [Dissostichus eleginoides]|uniref:Cytochrome c oxidase subunit 2 n=1 Tax=Dissostichus eleginoides TaxID=100907 RepID=A0AAD9C651_DISEL|nr:cytochrome c oxidase subunit 2 [Dissostichus eleginoides]
MQTVRVKYKDHQKYICYEGQLTFKSFLDCVAKKFDIPTLDLKVFDVTKTEVDEEVFEFLIQKQDLGVLEICLPQDPNDSLSSSASASVSSYSDVDSDDTIILQRSPASTTKEEDSRLAKMIEDILKNKPGGERIMNEYARTKSLTDARRRDMVKMLVAQMTSYHGTSPSRRVKEEYAKGITSLFPNLADPRSKFGFEHYYNAEDGSGYLAWRLKFVQKGASEGQKEDPASVTNRWSKS